MENENMNYDDAMENEVEAEEAETESSGIGTGAAMLIGAGLTMATAAIVKLGKKLFAAHKAKKESLEAEEDDSEDVADEE